MDDQSHDLFSNLASCIGANERAGLKKFLINIEIDGEQHEWSRWAPDVFDAVAQCKSSIKISHVSSVKILAACEAQKVESISDLNNVVHINKRRIG